MPLSNQESKSAIAELQTFLRAIYLEDPEVNAPPIDGIWESDTENALRAFQASQGLSVTGRADQKTWELLLAAYRATLAYSYLPRPMQLFPVFPKDYVIKKGDVSFPVAALQYALRELEYIYGDPLSISIDGKYEDETEEAIRHIQERNGIPVTGSTDLLTWNRVMDLYNTLDVR